MQLTNFKLGIGLPLTDAKVHSQFLDSYVRLRKPDNYIYLRPMYPSQDIAEIRNAIVRQAQEAGVTHLLMIDTDETFPPDLIEKLLSHNLPIVGGKVHRRYPPYDPILYEFDEEKQRYYLMDDEVWSKNGLVEVEATGGGCLLINMRVFEKIEYPYFKFIPKEDSELNQAIGEDIYFCRKVRAAGIPIHVDTEVQIGHLGLMEVNEHFYFLTKMLDEVRNRNTNQQKE